MLAQPTAFFWSLCELTETFLHVCQRDHVEVWAEFGTLLGIVRHGHGLIPWDGAAHFGILATNREKLFSVFADEANKSFLQTKSGKKLVLDLPSHGNSGRATVRLNGGNAAAGPVLDIVSYHRVAESIVPVEAIDGSRVVGDDGLPADKMFPLKKSTLLGMLVHIPQREHDVLASWFGENGKEIPEQCRNYMAARYLGPATIAVREVDGVTAFSQVVAAIEEAGAGAELGELAHCHPLLFRNTALLSTTEEIFADTICQETKRIYGYGGKDQESVELGAMEAWEHFRAKSLDVNVVDAQGSFGSQFLPPEWIEYSSRKLRKTNSLADEFSWVLTNAPKITNFHTDPPRGNGWMKLVFGEKIWWCICGADLQHLASKGITADRIAGMYMSELLQLDDGYLFGRIRVCIARADDIFWFPIPTSHKVFTTCDSIGFGGYL